MREAVRDGSSSSSSLLNRRPLVPSASYDRVSNRALLTWARRPVCAHVPLTTHVLSACETLESGVQRVDRTCILPSQLPCRCRGAHVWCVMNDMTRHTSHMCAESCHSWLGVWG